LGGEKYRPSDANNKGEDEPLELKIELSNGLVVQRKGKNSSLKVTDPNGLSGGQGVLDKFVEKLALDLPRFISANAKEKAEILLKIIGAGDSLTELDLREDETFNNRRAARKELDKARKILESMSGAVDVPEKVSVSELISEIEKAQEIASKKAHYQGLIKSAEAECDRLSDEIKYDEEEMDKIRARVKANETKLAQVFENVVNMTKETEAIDVPDIEPLREKIDQAEKINAEAAEAERHNNDLMAARKRFEDAGEEYDSLEEDLKFVRQERQDLLANADMPLDGLSVEDGELTYNGAKWDCMSAADQLMVATSIVKQLNPECGFVLMDKLEQMDIQTLAAFNSWAESQNLQVIATRVSTGDECSIIIEDGQEK